MNECTEVAATITDQRFPTIAAARAYLKQHNPYWRSDWGYTILDNMASALCAPPKLSSKPLSQTTFGSHI